jgi:HPr kinase/phosphorylase
MQTSPVIQPALTIETLLRDRGQDLALQWMNPEVPCTQVCSDPDVSSPGLALAGYLARLPFGRMLVLGETEVTYLATLSVETRTERLTQLLENGPPALFVTKGQALPDGLLPLASAHGVPVLVTAHSTRDFFRRIKPFLEVALAPETSLHGSLADVYGVGLLFVGESGIGKSECVLDLVERGHRLVADDLVLVSRRGNDLLIGRGHRLQGHHMEIRGVGIIDVRALFGIRAIRQQKRVEVIVRLERWDDNAVYDRTGLQREEVEILGVSIPQVRIPLNPGKNVTVVSEVVAMNHLLRYSGVDSAAEFDQRLRASMAPLETYLEEDDE